MSYDSGNAERRQIKLYFNNYEYGTILWRLSGVMTALNFASWKKFIFCYKKINSKGFQNIDFNYNNNE